MSDITFDDLIPKQQPQPQISFDDLIPERAQPGSFQDGYFAQGMSGVNQGLANTLGLPVDAANWVIGKGMDGINAVAGTDLQPSERPLLGSRQISDWMQDAGSIVPESADDGKKFVRRVGEEVGATVVPGAGAIGKAEKPMRALSGLFASSLGSGVGAATANQVAPDNALVELGGQLAGGFSPMALSRIMKQRATKQAAEAAVPTIDELKDAAKIKYGEAEKLGVTAGREQVQGVGRNFDEILDSEGVLIGADELAEGYPKLNAVRRQMDRFGQADMTVPQMQTMRRTLQKAAQSADDTEARLGSMLIKPFDQFTAPLAPQLAEGNRLYHRAMKGKQLDQLKELAGSRARQFSGSGFENALRTEYRGLERKIIKGQETRFNPEEAAAISRVAQGTKRSNLARDVGRFAPTGPVSAMAGMVGPTALGTSMFGPMGGIAMGTLGGGVGFAGRSIATKAGLRNAELADILVRNGAPIKTDAQLTPALRQLATALLAAQGTNQLNNVVPK